MNGAMSNHPGLHCRVGLRNLAHSLTDAPDLHTLPYIICTAMQKRIGYLLRMHCLTLR